MATHNARSKPAPPRSTAKPKNHRWSRHVMETSDALDIEPDIFKSVSYTHLTLPTKRIV